MIHKVFFDIDAIRPGKMEVLVAMGMKGHHKVSSRVESSLDLAFGLFEKNVEPVGIYSPVSKHDFTDIYEGQGRNSNESPIRDIYPRSDALHIFALTLGDTIVTCINDLNEKGDYAVSHILNTIASSAADKAAGELETIVSRASGNSKNGGFTLGYSPGYCGWDISGQEKLFEYLDPGSIGVTLNSSYLMKPVKSVSGVIISGTADIHAFVPGYPFCKPCKTKSCIPRLKGLKEHIGKS